MCVEVACVTPQHEGIRPALYSVLSPSALYGWSLYLTVVFFLCVYVYLQISVSEYMSLIKELTGKTGSSARARTAIRGFDKKKAYKLLRCVDKDGDRRVALRDLVAFIFATWTEELHRLAGAKGDAEDLRQTRRQLQKV